VYQLLDAVNDSQLWKNLLSSLPNEVQDVYFLPEYCALENDKGTTRATLFAFEQNGQL